jgi:lipoprotein-releasing system ATP-binding protein
MNDDSLAVFRNKTIGFIFQFHHLLPEFTALENVCIPAFIGGTPRKEAEAQAMKLLAMMDLSARVTHKPSALSGGEQQRVAVARALINHPRIVLADEPSGNLDSASAKELHQLFFRLRDEIGQTFIIVTHNQELAKMADRRITMKDGKIG